MKPRTAAAAVAIFLCLLGCNPPPEPLKIARLAYPHEMVSLDPHAHNDSVTGTILSAVYEALVTYSAEGVPEPGLAVEWDNPEPTVWRFRLREGVLFHDGRPLTPSDVVASFDRVRFDFGLAVATYLEPIIDVRRVPGRMDLVEMSTRAPTPRLLDRIGMVAITPQHLDPQRPVGTGPYRWSAGRERGPVVLSRWQQYWGQAPAMDEIHISFVASAEVLASRIEADNLDVMATVSFDFLRTLDLPQDWRLVQIPSRLTMVLGLNLLTPPLDDPRVRHAIDMALDREAMVAAILPRCGARPATAFVSDSQASGLSQTAASGPDPERARQMLTEAGGTPETSLRIHVLGVPDPVIAVLTENLASVGIEVEPVRSSYPSKYHRLAAAQHELFLFGWNFRGRDPSTFLDSMVHSRDPERRTGLLNGSGFSDPEVDRWLEEAAQEQDPERRSELLDRVQQRVLEARPYLPLYHRPRLALFRQPFSFKMRRGFQVFPQDIVAGR